MKSFFSKLFSKFISVLSTIQYSIRAYKSIGLKEVFFPLFVKVSTAVAFCYSIIEILQSVLNFQIMDFINEYDIGVKLIVCVLIAIFLIILFVKYYKIIDSFYDVRYDYRNEIIDKYDLSVSAKKNKHKIYDFEFNGVIEKYIMSHEVNNMLLTSSKNISINKMKKHRLPNEYIVFLPYIINKLKRTKKEIFDGKLLGIVDDININTKEVRVRQVSYFDTMCTHEVVYTSIYRNGNVNAYVKGEELLFDTKNKVIKDMGDMSVCTNLLGATTLLISQYENKNYFWLTTQGAASAVNKHKIVPSGSGSVDSKDLKGKTNFHELLTCAMERELSEECNVNQKLNTSIIGYVRLLERGGKPDFFGLSFYSGDIIKKDVRVKERHLIEGFDVVEFKSHLTLAEELEAWCENKSISIQMHITINILKNLKDSNIELYNKMFVDLGFVI